MEEMIEVGNGIQHVKKIKWLKNRSLGQAVFHVFDVKQRIEFFSIGKDLGEGNISSSLLFPAEPKKIIK